MNFENLKSKDNSFVANTYKRFDVAIESGKGSKCYDFDGKDYIDFTSGIGVNSLGFANDKINDALINQINKFTHISNLFYTEPCANLAELLCNATGMKKVFFSNSGAEANEGAIKTARKYSYDKYGEGRNEIISLNNSFHGRTMATLTATGQDSFHQYFYPFIDGFKYGDANMDDVKALVCNKTCAIMIEIIQGEGGVIPLPGEFIKELDSFCKDNDIILIVDEVQTGIGRTGTLFAYEDYDINPDIVTTAKGLGGGLPIGAILFSDKTENVLGFGAHGSTFGGNLLSCTAGVEVIKEVNNKEFLNEVKAKGDYMAEKIEKLPKVKSVFHKGLMFGIELEDGTTPIDVLNKSIDNGLLILTAKTKIRFLPPLNISYEEIDEGIKRLEKSLKEI